MVKINNDNRGAPGSFNHVNRSVSTVGEGLTSLAKDVGVIGLTTIKVTGSVLIIASIPISVPVISIATRQNPKKALVTLTVGIVNIWDINLVPFGIED